MQYRNIKSMHAFICRFLSYPHPARALGMTASEAMDIDTDTASASSAAPTARQAARQLALDEQPWVEKYRPASLDELISHKDIISTISRFIDEDIFPHLLFYGPPGTGKTSTILACARKLYGKNFKVRPCVAFRSACAGGGVYGGVATRL